MDSFSGSLPTTRTIVRWYRFSHNRRHVIRVSAHMSTCTPFVTPSIARDPDIKQEPKRSTSPCELPNALWTATSRISSIINETRPVYRLPPEVLTAIFTHHRSHESTKRYKWFTWVRLMSVSHKWRSTILPFPSLWSVIRLDGEISSEGIRMLLERSGGHPLEVIVPDPSGHQRPCSHA